VGSAAERQPVEGTGMTIFGPIVSNLGVLGERR
jgi:hypothetical protein